MSANEYGIRTGEDCDIRFEEITDVDVDAWGSEAMGVFLDDGLTFWTDLEGFDVQMRELQTDLDGNAAGTEADVPKDMMTGKVEGLKCQQTNGHLGNHFLAAIKEHECRVGEAEDSTRITINWTRIIININLWRIRV